MKTIPTISVLLPIYKESITDIKRAVDSILNQTFRNLELIIILDDPQNFDAIQLIKNYATVDSRILYNIHEKNMGIALGLNEGVRLSQGEFIARQDADDFSHKNRLELQYNYLINNPEVHVVGTALMYIDVESEIKFEVKHKQIVGAEIKRASPVAHPTLLIRKDTFFNFGFYKVGLVIEDYNLWIHWYSKGVIFHNLPIVLYDYYNPFSIKSQKIKLYLIHTIRCKWNNRKLLNFKFMDLQYFLFEYLVCLLPSFVLIRLVMIFYRKKSLKY